MAKDTIHHQYLSGRLPLIISVIGGYIASETVALQWRHTEADFSIWPPQDGQIFVCHQARLDGAGAAACVAVLIGFTDQTSATIQPMIVQPSSQLSATIGFQSG